MTEILTAEDRKVLKDNKIAESSWYQYKLVLDVLSKSRFRYVYLKSIENEYILNLNYVSLLNILKLHGYTWKEETNYLIEVKEAKEI